MATRCHAAYAIKIGFLQWPAKQLISYIRCGTGLLAVAGVSPVGARAFRLGQSCVTGYLADITSVIGGHLS